MCRKAQTQNAQITCVANVSDQDFVSQVIDNLFKGYFTFINMTHFVHKFSSTL
jgi:intein-encoded DNA endonuclease-like protein